MKILRIWSLAGAVLLPFLLPAAVTVETLSGRMTELSPDVQKHLTQVLQAIAPLENGKFLLDKVSPEVTFQAKPMAQLGVANTFNAITLESLRLENCPFPDTTERHKKAKLCFTAEILSHELLHNAQMNSGLFRYPANCSPLSAVLFEKLLELQAKFFGDKTFYDLRETPAMIHDVQPKSGLWLVMKRTSKTPEKDYLAVLWGNRRDTPSGFHLYKEQTREVAFWNQAYAEQAFRNNYGRFAAAAEIPAPSGEDAAHLQKIIDFLQLPVTPEELLKNACVQAIPHGISCWENGVKVMELEAVPEGYVKRLFSGSRVRETRVLIQR